LQGTGLTWKGTWKRTVDYKINDLVLYARNTYICVEANRDKRPDPTKPYFWELFSVGGTDGLRGADGRQGVDGAAGANGAKGDKGDKGDPGDPGVGGGGSPTISKINDNAGTIVKCQPVYIKSNAHIDLAQADAGSTSEVIGLVMSDTIATTDTGDVVLMGPVQATTGEWDVVTGGSGGLTPGSVYYLDPTTPGMITETAPTTVGQRVVRLGIASSETTFSLIPNAPIQL
jgi:hypothetical protein